MLDKHIYSEEFFTFIKDIITCITVPSDYIYIKEYHFPIIYKNYQAIDQEKRRIFINILEFISKLAFDIVAKANDENNVILLNLNLN